MKYAIVKEQTDDGSWWVHVPDLPGCFSWGETPDDATRNAIEAIEGHLGVMRDFGDPMPARSSGDEVVEVVEIADVL